MTTPKGRTELCLTTTSPRRAEAEAKVAANREVYAKLRSEQNQAKATLDAIGAKDHVSAADVATRENTERRLRRIEGELNQMSAEIGRAEKALGYVDFADARDAANDHADHLKDLLQAFKSRMWAEIEQHMELCAVASAARFRLPGNRMDFRTAFSDVALVEDKLMSDLGRVDFMFCRQRAWQHHEDARVRHSIAAADPTPERAQFQKNVTHVLYDTSPLTPSTDTEH